MDTTTPATFPRAYVRHPDRKVNATRGEPRELWRLSYSFAGLRFFFRGSVGFSPVRRTLQMRLEDLSASLTSSTTERQTVDASSGEARPMRANLEPNDNPRGELKTISEMSTCYGVSLRTLRFYEDRGLIQPKRVGSHRLYSGRDEVRVQIILKAKRFGFTLSEIERLVLSRVETSFISDQPELDLTTEAILTPALVKSKLDKLEKLRESTCAAIEELTASMH